MDRNLNSVSTFPPGSLGEAFKSLVCSGGRAVLPTEGGFAMNRGGTEDKALSTGAGPGQAP